MPFYLRPIARWLKNRIPLGVLTLGYLFACAPHAASQTLQSEKKVSTYLENNPQSSIFVAALKQSGVWDTLDASEPMTLFLPTNAALKREGSAFLLEVVLNKKENKKRLHNLMTTHIYKGKLDITKDTDQLNLLSFSNGSCFTVEVKNNLIKIGPEAQVTNTVRVSGGIIYFIDHLLWVPYQDQRNCS